MFLTIAVDESTNYDLDNIITPVDVDSFEKHLIHHQYNREETAFLVEGFHNGFEMGYRG